LKGLNIVYDDDGKIKYIDFGSIVFESKEYGKYGYTEYYNFFQFIDLKERYKY
jgi:hypothetical protein